MSIDNGRSPAAKVMDEAIEGRSPYPERAAFIDSDIASADHEIKRAADKGLPVVMVAEDGRKPLEIALRIAQPGDSPSTTSLSAWRRLRLALSFASARVIHAPPPFFAPACSVLTRL